MHKIAATTARDPKQEKIRADKRAWTKKVKAFIDDIHQFKKLMNGYPNKFYAEKSRITSPIPNDPISVIAILLSDFQNICSEGKKIVHQQQMYSESFSPGFQAKNASRISANSMEKEASNRISRFVSNFKGPIFFGSKTDKLTNKFRLALLKSLASIKEHMRDLQTDILFKPLDKYPDIGSEAEQLALKAKEFNTVQKSYKSTLFPDESSGDSNYQIINDLKAIRSELKTMTTFPVFPQKKIVALTRRLQGLLKKLDTDTSISLNMSDSKIERNVIKNEFIEIKQSVLATWQSVFPDANIETIKDIEKALEITTLSYEEIVLRAKNNSSENPNVVEQKRKELITKMQSDLIFATQLPVYLNKETLRVAKQLEILLTRVESGRFSKASIDIEINSLIKDFKHVLSKTLILWNKLLLRDLSHISSYKELHQAWVDSGISEEEIVDSMSGFPRVQDTKGIETKFLAIIGSRKLLKEVSREHGDGLYMKEIYENFIEDFKSGPTFEKFPYRTYKNVLNICDSAMDRDHFPVQIMNDTVSSYTEVLEFVNHAMTESGILPRSFFTFKEMVFWFKDNGFDESKVALANAITYNIAKRIGELKAKISFGDKNSAIKLTLSDIYTKAIDFVNQYMNILEDRILTGEEFEELNKALEELFQSSKDPLKALETAYLITVYDDADTDTAGGYSKNLKKVLRKKDEASIRKLV